MGGDAVEVWPQALDLASRLVDQLPMSRSAHVYFLGCGMPYEARSLRSLVAGWREGHRTRTRLVSPVFERLEAEPNTTVVLLAADSPFDIDDWAASPVADRTICVRLADSPIACLAHRDCPPDLDRLVQRLQQKIIRVRVVLPGAMPVDWDNGSYHLAEESLEAADAEYHSVCIGWLSGADSPPQAEVIRSDGMCQTLSLSPCDPVEPATWRTLSGRETLAYRAALAGDDIPCPYGDHTHPPREVKCKVGRNFLGTPLYGAELARHRGFVVLRDQANRVECRAHSCETLRVGPDLVAVYREGRAALKRFSPRTGVWIAAGEFIQYQPAGDDSHAILL